MRCVNIENIAKLYNIITKNKKIPIITSTYLIINDKNEYGYDEVYIKYYNYTGSNINITSLKHIHILKLNKNIPLRINIIDKYGYFETMVTMNLPKIYNMYRNNVVYLRLVGNIPICGNPSLYLLLENKNILMEITGEYNAGYINEFINMINKLIDTIISIFVVL